MINAKSQINAGSIINKGAGSIINKAAPKKEEGRLKTAQLREVAATLARKSWADLTDEDEEEN